MREFLALQKRIFPAYFKCQVGLVILTAVTRPPRSILSLAWDTVPLAIVGVTGALNWFVFGPKTTTAAVVRRGMQGELPCPFLSYSLLYLSFFSATATHVLFINN